MGRLEADVCRECLDHPKLGRKWAEMAHRVRNDVEVARKVYNHITTEEGRLRFIQAFGLPAGMEAPECMKPQPTGPMLRLVN